MARGRPYVIGIDGGTESLRVGIYDLDGNPITYSSVPYSTAFPHPGWAEQDPDAWWSALVEAVPEALAASGIDPADVIGLGVDTTACTLVFLDENKRPLRPALLWMDVRASDQARRVSAIEHRALKYLGQSTMSAEWMPAKALWVKEHQADVYDRTAHVCEYVDYLAYMLTGQLTASLNTTSIRWLYNHREGGWAPDYFERIGLGDLVPRFPPSVLPMEAVAGYLTPSAAAATGLPEGLPVAKGGADAFVAMLGLDVVAPGRVALITGSSHLQLGQSATPLHVKGMFGTYPDAVVQGSYTFEGGQISTGSIMRWFATSVLGFGRDDGAGQQARLIEQLSERAAAIAPGAEGLILLDYWQGNRTPHVDAEARGAMWGFSLNHRAEHVARAIMEGVAFGTERIFAVMRNGGVGVDDVYAAGGATRSPLWMQIHADVSNVPIHLTKVGDAASLGSAILAAVAAEAYTSIEEASAQMVTVTHTVEPVAAQHRVYRDYYDLYCETYERLGDLMHRAAVLSRSESGARAREDLAAERVP
jgi:ribulokinase